MIVTLLTDYGHDDEFVGVCHGVIRGICPGAEIVDITHGVPRHDVRRGAAILHNTLAYMPVGIHVAIVDPQVGTERRALAARTTDGRVLVGPDNGLLSLAWKRCGGLVEAVDVSRSQHRLEPISATFHGRDLFAPVAAHLAAGADLREAGEPVAPEELRTIELPTAHLAEGVLVGHVVAIDGFGNASLGVDHELLVDSGLRLGEPVEVEVHGELFLASFAQTFADVGPGEVLVYEDAYRSLALAINRGDAATTLRLGADDEVVLRPR